ncbi:hypothetical protein FH972_012556 [Carpinus fangiana]|uniref:Plant heme peroxidase family profile domain-containing protein n=1 Tax=Carpinus fangiana TaxID=176857 RepID=A0A5N6R7A5_9ROSI|nr:hypothetical protein FH972_012556 [Carpinus fangiana]
MCPHGVFNDRIPLDPVTNSTFDYQSLQNMRDGFVVLASINLYFLPKWKATCPHGDFNDQISLDPVTNSTFDHQSLRNMRDGFVVLASDARQNEDINTNRVIRFYINQPCLIGRSSFVADFTRAIVKISKIGV